MREIIFRGLRVDGGGWVYGDLKKVSDYRRGGAWYYIYVDGKDIDEDGEELRVEPYSVGQFTGIKGSNGVDIYEGDILEYYCSTFNRAEVQKVIFGWYYTDNDGRCHENVMGWVDEDGFPIDTQEKKYTIIGNIHQQK